MTRLILASNSAQRKQLLKRTGFQFEVIPSRVEEMKTITTSCSNFVKHNALIKAEDVAKQVKIGIVIGADTIVYLGHRKIIGKPKNIQEAKANLKILFSQSHWVYTGVALINIQNQERLVDYEKTKLFMNKLSDDEIDRYYQKMSPLDKAGGFDIEGYGGLFIRRIEGCYSNVIGLPMARLTAMLKKMGVSIV
jgi:septum formation protein